MTHSAETIYDEVAYIAYHLGWARGDILDLEHAERSQYVARINRLDAARSRGG